MPYTGKVVVTFNESQLVFDYTYQEKDSYILFSRAHNGGGY